MLDLTKMNQSQREAVTWSGGPLLLLAGPGSGKTFTITNRILYLLEQGIAPEQILVITFTRDAAESMQNRFQKLSDKFYPVNFGTFHSVFYHILQESGGFRNLKLIQHSKKRNLLIPILKKLDNRNPENTLQTESEEDVEKVLSAISFYKNTEELEKTIKKMPVNRQNEFQEIFWQYERALRASGEVDFDDMLFACRRLLAEDNRVRQYWQGRFSHILIDEFQDCNPIQYQIIKLLTSKSCKVFAVGDDDQSVYGFRGAQPDIMRCFEQEFQAEKLLLNINYRCEKKIIEASLAVIGENQDRFIKQLQPAQGKQEGKVCVKAFLNKDEEMQYLSEQLQKWQREHENDREFCAVLFRTNAHMQRTASVLKRAGVRYQMKEKAQSIYEHFIVRDIMAYLLLAEGEWKREHLLRIINKPSRYISREAVGEGRSIKEMIIYYENCYCEADIKIKILKNLEQLQRGLECLKSMKPAMGVSYILKALGYEKYLRRLAGRNEEKMEEWSELLQWLREDVGAFSEVKEWREMQEVFSREQDRQKAMKREMNQEKIKLMTVHGAKGLEFHTVLIPDCNEGVFPHGSMPDSVTVEEERRLFYVAMTRAKKSLKLLYLGGDNCLRLPSRFLNPLLYSSSSINSSNSQLSRYSSKASATFSYSSSSAMKSSTGSSLGSSGFSL